MSLHQERGTGKNCNHKPESASQNQMSYKLAWLLLAGWELVTEKWCGYSLTAICIADQNKTCREYFWFYLNCLRHHRFLQDEGLSLILEHLSIHWHDGLFRLTVWEEVIMNTHHFLWASAAALAPSHDCGTLWDTTGYILSPAAV